MPPEMARVYFVHVFPDSCIFYFPYRPIASEASVSVRSLRAEGAGAERAPAARRRRNTPGGPPAQGASAPERASRPEGARGAPGRASAARGAQAHGRTRSTARGSAGGQPYKTWIL